MSVFAIGDLHMPGGQDKPMHIFGPQWENHFEHIRTNWEASITPQDLVLIPGDISWAMKLADARADLQTIGALPGLKCMVRGNHDYWWNGIAQVRAILPPTLTAIQHDAFVFGNIVVAGSRGWGYPNPEDDTYAEDTKIYNRELIRTALSLKAATRAASSQGGRDKDLVVMMHYPPVLDNGKETPFTALFDQFGVRDVVFGHVHGSGIRNTYTGVVNRTRYHLVSADSLDFNPVKIL